MSKDFIDIEATLRTLHEKALLKSYDNDCCTIGLPGEFGFLDWTAYELALEMENSSNVAFDKILNCIFESLPKLNREEQKYIAISVDMLDVYENSKPSFGLIQPMTGSLMSVYSEVFDLDFNVRHYNSCLEFLKEKCDVFFGLGCQTHREYIEHLISRTPSREAYFYKTLINIKNSIKNGQVKSQSHIPLGCFDYRIFPISNIKE